MIVRERFAPKQCLKIGFIDAFFGGGTRRVQRKVPRFNVSAQNVEHYSDFVGIVDDGRSGKHYHFRIFSAEQIAVHLHRQRCVGCF